MTPLGAGSISLRLYPHDELAAPAIVDALRTQAALAADHGFDGVMTSEHHGGFAGYLPNPLQAAGWCLEAMATGWAAPCPLLLPLRPTALVAEEVAWLAARFPERVGIGVAAGALEADFELMDTTMDDLGARFAAALEDLVEMVTGSAPGGLANDPAIQACAEQPIPVVSAAMSATAARRAARLGAGLLFDSLTTPERCRELSDDYRAFGGTGTCILVRRAWLGDPPTDRVDRQVDVYRGYAAPGAQSHWEGDQLVAAADGIEIADGLLDAMRRAGADALNLRVHVPGVPLATVHDQITRLGNEVLPHLRQTRAT